MKLRILSDLHLEYFDCNPPAVSADAVILAGDIATGNAAIFWAADTFGSAGAPVFYIPGNHEFYGTDVDAWYASAARCAEAQGILLGDKLSYRLEKAGETPVRVLGTTLWTDFALFGADRVDVCGALTQQALRNADYGRISYQGRMLQWADTKAFHERELAWLKQECLKAAAAGEKVVVVAHHAPSITSSESKYRRNLVTAGFASNLEEFIEQYVDLFVHGHMHSSSDYRKGRCRVIANPRGYPLYPQNPKTKFENPQFNPVLVVEI
jgi:3',5'-cyclic AMP phosphodiesterase CpdA